MGFPLLPTGAPDPRRGRPGFTRCVLDSLGPDEGRGMATL